MANIGRIQQVIGPVVDVSFADENSKLPEIYTALEVERSNGTKLILEVCLLYTSPSPRDRTRSRMPSSA